MPATHQLCWWERIVGLTARAAARLTQVPRASPEGRCELSLQFGRILTDRIESKAKKSLAQRAAGNQRPFLFFYTCVLAQWFNHLQAAKPGRRVEDWPGICGCYEGPGGAGHCIETDRQRRVVLRR